MASKKTIEALENLREALTAAGPRLTPQEFWDHAGHLPTKVEEELRARLYIERRHEQDRARLSESWDRKISVPLVLEKLEEELL